MSTRHKVGAAARSAPPRLTILLAAAALSWMAWADQEQRRVAERSDAQLAEAAEYLLAHPYLEAHSAVVAMLGEEALETRREVHQGEVRRSGGFGVSESRRSEEQARLDALLADYEREQAQIPVVRFGLRAGQSGWHTWLSHVVAHAGWLTLATNLLLLLVLGGFAERTWQSRGYALLILGSAASTAGFVALGHPELERPLVGLGGVLAGTVGAAATGVARGRREPGWVVGLALGTGWLALPLASGIEWSFGPGPGAEEGFGTLLSPWVHAAGLGFGCLFGLLASPGRRPGDAARAAESPRSLFEQAQQALHVGEREKAFALLAQLLREHPADRAAGLSMWQVARAIGRPLDAVPALLRVIREELRRGQHDEAVAHWLELGSAEVPVRAEPALLFAIATQLEEREQCDAAIAALELALADREGGARTAAAVARAARALDAELSQRAAWRALAEPALPSQERISLEHLLAELRAAGSLAATGGADARAPLEPARPSAPAAPRPPSSGGDEVEQWEDPQLLTDDAPRHALELHGAVDLASIQIDVDLDCAPPVEATAASPPPRAAEVLVPMAEPPLGALPGVDAGGERGIELLQAVPIELGEAALRLEIVGVGKKKLRYEQIQAIAVGAIRGRGSRAHVAVDLVLNWRERRDQPLKVVRLRSDRFDPARFAPPGGTAPEALRGLIDRLLERSGAHPMPDPRSARGLPYATFEDLESFQREVLGAEG